MAERGYDMAGAQKYEFHGLLQMALKPLFFATLMPIVHYSKRFAISSLKRIDKF
jgi:hypothetical protein